MLAQEQEVDLLTDDYTIVQWPDRKMHSLQFPYIIILQAPGVFSIIGVPQELENDLELLFGWCLDFVKRYRLHCCLVFAADKCIFFDPKAGVAPSDQPPCGGVILHWEKVQSGRIKSISIVNGKLFYIEADDGCVDILRCGVTPTEFSVKGLPSPQRTNPQHFDIEIFPEVIGFCDRDDATHFVDDDKETYEYKLFGELVFKVTKTCEGWKIEEYLKDKMVSWSLGKKLRDALIPALCYGEDRNKERCTIYFVVHTEDASMVHALMYHLGGYPASYLPASPELEIAADLIVDPEIKYLRYTKVPQKFVPWLGQVFSQEGIIGQDHKRRLYYFVQEDEGSDDTLA